MKISILCSSPNHPVYPFLQNWSEQQANFHQVELVNSKAQLNGGDLLFLISCNEIVGKAVRGQYRSTLVIHASDLPRGRGWSPHIWQILQGCNSVTVTLLEAEDAVDSGAIWAQRIFELEGHELHNEINERLFQIELDLMDFAVAHFDNISPKPQADEQPTYFPKRTPEDSRLEPQKSIAEQFDLLRVADPDRFPGFFDFRGYRYEIKINKVKKLEG